MMEAERRSITVVNAHSGRKYPIVLLYQQGAPSDTFAALRNTVQGAAYDVQFSTANPAMLSNFSIIDKTGLIKLAGNDITDGTATISENTSIATLTQMVIS